MSGWWVLAYLGSVLFIGTPLGMVWLEWRERRGYSLPSADDALGLGMPMSFLWPLIIPVAWAEWVIRDVVPTGRIWDAVHGTFMRLLPPKG